MVEPKVLKCPKCRCHGLDVEVRGHRNSCEYQTCQCVGCKNVQLLRDKMKHDWKLRRETRLPQSPIGPTSRSHNTNSHTRQQRKSVIVGPISARKPAGSSVASKLNKKPNKKAVHSSGAGTSSEASSGTTNTAFVDLREFFMI